MDITKAILELTPFISGVNDVTLHFLEVEVGTLKRLKAKNDPNAVIIAKAYRGLFNDFYDRLVSLREKLVFCVEKDSELAVGDAVKLLLTGEREATLGKKTRMEGHSFKEVNKKVQDLERQTIASIAKNIDTQIKKIENMREEIELLV